MWKLEIVWNQEPKKGRTKTLKVEKVHLLGTFGYSCHVAAGAFEFFDYSRKQVRLMMHQSPSSFDYFDGSRLQRTHLAHILAV